MSSGGWAQFIRALDPTAIVLAGIVVALASVYRLAAADQARALETLSATTPAQPPAARPVRTIRTTPMSAAEWSATYDKCVEDLGKPFILASRSPGISAGVYCIPLEVLGE